MATLKDIAKITGVSIKTVSRAVNNSGYVRKELREKILAEAERIGYVSNRAAKNLRSSVSDEVYVISWDMDELFVRKFTAFEEEMRKAGYQVILVSMHEKDRDYKDKILRQILIEKPVGVLLLTGRFYNIDETLDKFKQAGINYLQLDTSQKSSDGIYIDRAAGVYDAVKILAQRTEGRIGYLGISHQEHDWTRLEGFRRAIEEVGRESVELFPPNIASIFAAGVESAAMIIEHKIGALQVYSDLLAMGVLYGLQKLGVRVPEDILLVGFDDRDFSAYASPPLSTIRQPNLEAGVLAAKVMLNIIHGTRETDSSLVIPTTFIERESTMI